MNTKFKDDEIENIINPKKIEKPKENVIDRYKDVLFYSYIKGLIKNYAINNVLICIQANTLEELNKTTKLIKSIGNEHLISIYNLDWQQLEGIQNCLSFGWNNLQIQRSLTTNTHINPFDSSLQYTKDSTEAIKEKSEFVLAFIESIVGLTEGQKTIVDRCTKNIYEEYQFHKFDKRFQPDFKKFYYELLKQPEREAKNLSLVIERYVKGGMDIFANDTNIQIKNRFISFDISDLPNSIQTTGYLVVLEHIMNRLKRNKNLGKHTWIFVDEFHILLANQYSADYIAKIYKTGRKENAIPTVITQNIADVLKSEQGCKILSNSEFAMILKQKPLDLPAICKIFDISDEEAKYVIDSPVGQGLVVYGEDKVAFRNQVSKESYIYKLNQTSNMQEQQAA